MGDPTKKPPRPDWGDPRPKVRPRTPAEKLADTKRENERLFREAKRDNEQRDKEALQEKKEADRKIREQQDRERIHGPQWMERRTRCAGSLGILSNQIKIRKNDWSNVATEVSIAYEAAYTSLTKILDTKNTQDQLLFSIAFTSLAAVSVGGLAVVFTKAGDKWIKQGATQLFVDAAEDAVQAGVGGMLTNVVAPLAAAGAKFEATAIPSPFTLQGELDMLLNDMESGMLKWCVNHQKEINNLPLSDFEFYDPQKLDDEIASFLAEKDKQFNSKPFLVAGRSKLELTAELEKLMVGLWSVSFCEKVFSQTFKQRFPKPIIDRLVKYGFVSDVVSDRGLYSNAFVLRMADWGPVTERVMRRVVTNVKTYQAKKFG